MTDTGAAPSLTEERLEILRLVENQTISADEATRLLEALDRSDNSQQQQATRNRSRSSDPDMTATTRLPAKPRARNVRIRITDTASKEVRLNLVLPLGLLDSGLKMAKRIAPDRLLESKEIKESVEEGYVGAILDIVDEDERVEILIEARE
ncbi:MAG: SHOCT-like domain-containing protein [Thermomicrobiales bacterium]